MTPRIRRWGLLLAALLAGATAAHDDALPPAQEVVRQHLLGDARAALSRGEPDAALVPLETAAGMSHAADTELLQLQMQLQAGHIRQALAFAAHTAAAHRDEPAARALHLWLLAVSGQADYARRRLNVGDPSDAALVRLLDGLALDQPLPGAAPAPWPHGVAVPQRARPVTTGLLLDAGQLALVPASAAQGNATLWLRNGLGRASHARRAAADPDLAALGLALLHVEPPLPATSSLTRAPRPAFAGSPASRLGMPRVDSAGPAWPVLQLGFLGRTDRHGAQALGWPRGALLSGGPVFDGAGRLIGLAMPGEDGGEHLLPAAALPGLPVRSDAQAVTPDELYEGALPHIAQLLR
ncbi:hypothetical protein [Pelomonas cellulosilytica]|uniref:Tetratricopeptide repeat protein n=1 Tax=Pelomonas cellulosilytica TaxID=2906762 RepID=A0ABS8XWW2_9BURK|nr:hypothetical protein [Pelomonas sp. P8]MCE4557147.1 hypothetical protein [Pelomonas sp. P8]